MKEKANYPNKKNKKNNKIDHFLAFRRKAKNSRPTKYFVDGLFQHIHRQQIWISMDDSFYNFVFSVMADHVSFLSENYIHVRTIGTTLS